MNDVRCGFADAVHYRETLVLFGDAFNKYDLHAELVQLAQTLE